MKRIVWLASFPKSGNTWVRLFLANYLQPSADTAVELSQLQLATSASSRALFDEWSCAEASDLSHDEIELVRPDVYRAIARQSEGLVFLKVHDAWTINRAGAPLFPADVTAAVIYVVRNPLDVAVSFAHHFDQDVSHVVAWMCSGTMVLDANSPAGALQLPQRLISWSDHFRSWTEDSALPAVVVRFEDLIAHPETEFQRIIVAAGLTLDEARVRAVLPLVTFERLQADERSVGFPERLSRSTPFFRSGRAGAWRGELASADADRLIAAHRPIMEALDYLTSDGQATF